MRQTYTKQEGRQSDGYLVKVLHLHSNSTKSYQGGSIPDNNGINELLSGNRNWQQCLLGRSYPW